MFPGALEVPYLRRVFHALHKISSECRRRPDRKCWKRNHPTSATCPWACATTTCPSAAQRCGMEYRVAAGERLSKVHMDLHQRSQFPALRKTPLSNDQETPTWREERQRFF